MKTKTVKLVDHNLQTEFYIQLLIVQGLEVSSEEATEQLIAEGKGKSYWQRLYKDLKDNQKLGLEPIDFIATFLEENWYDFFLQDDVSYLKWLGTLFNLSRDYYPDEGVIEEIVI